MSDETLAAVEGARQYLADLVVHRQVDREEAMPFVEALTRAAARHYRQHPADDGEPAGWRPIETAPRDGTHVLMWRETEGGQDVREAWWRTDGPLGAVWGGRGWSYPAWQQPSYWMPMPKPPNGR